MAKTLLILTIIGVVISGFVYFIKNSSNSLTVIHTVQFDPTACFSCYTCSCVYTVDYDKTYTKDQFNKTECIYNLDSDPNGKYHTLISDLVKNGQEQTSLKLNGSDYEKFNRCITNN